MGCLNDPVAPKDDMEELAKHDVLRAGSFREKVVQLRRESEAVKGKHHSGSLLQAQRS